MKYFKILLLVLLSVVFSFLCNAQKAPWCSNHFFGGQIGYSYSKSNNFDLGINYYWSKARDVSYPKAVHTFGPFLCARGIFNNDQFILGKQLGINYNYYGIFGPISARLNIAMENNENSDNRLGANIGFSYFGVYVNGGYFYPIGINENKEISRFRIGIMFIFNLSSMPYVTQGI